MSGEPLALEWAGVQVTIGQVCPGAHLGSCDTFGGNPEQFNLVLFTADYFTIQGF